MPLARLRRHALFSLAALLILADVARGETPWQPLWNGRDLAGWRVVGDAADAWMVEAGELQPARKGGWLATEREYGDFELELEYNLAAGSNSGIFLRAPLTGRSSREGMEIQLIDDFTKVYGPLEPWQLTGSLYHVAAAKSGVCKPAGEWQSIRVRCVGRALEVTLNGQAILHADLDAFPDLVAEHPGLKRSRGHVGLQNYGGRDARFRNVRLREIDPADAGR